MTVRGVHSGWPWFMNSRWIACWRGTPMVGGWVGGGVGEGLGRDYSFVPVFMAVVTDGALAH